jgi:putative membrane protein
MLVYILIRWLITAIAVAAAVLLIPGIEVGSNALIVVALTAAALGLINAIIRPILQFLSCGCIVATLGLFLFVINAATLLMAEWVAQNWFNLDFTIDGFWPALWGSIVISIVSFLLSGFAAPPDSRSTDPDF